MRTSQGTNERAAVTLAHAERISTSELRERKRSETPKKRFFGPDSGRYNWLSWRSSKLELR
jgi:hypothetical protein